MSGDELRRLRVATPLGAVALTGRAAAADETLPVLIGLPDVLSPGGSLNHLPDRLAGRAEVFVASFDVIGATVERLALALSHAVHVTFRGRPVVLLGVGSGGLIAAMAQAPEILRAVVVEPLLQSRNLAPLRERLSQSLQTETRPQIHELIADAYGANRGPDVPRNHLHLFRSRRTPVDLVVGERLPTDTAAAGTPSVVDAEERAWLAKQQSLAMRVAPGAGHAVMDDAPAVAVEMATAALAWAPTVRRRPQDLARRLAHAAPRDARRVLFVGAGVEDFEREYRTRNPDGVVLRTRPADGPVDLVLLVEPASDAPETAADLAVLAPDGVALGVVQLGPGFRRLEEAFVAAGLTIVAPDPAIPALASVVVRARKAPSRPVTRVDMVPVARTLMDIRTWLPAEGLRTDPALTLNFYPPPVSHGAPDAPRIVVLGRPGAATVEAWRTAAARSILNREVVVVEFDDHPALVSQIVRKQEMPDSAWELFRVAHAIQTSTDELIEVFRAHNPEVRVFPNSVFDLQPFPVGERPRRVFYGGVTRGPFVAEVARSLGPAIEAFPDTEFHVLGDREFFDALPTTRKVFNGYVPYEQYLAAMAACSISLSPLKERPMMETKSDAKYLDASRAGVLTIASPLVYERVIRSGENGLIAREMADWPAMLALALGDTAARERMARAAWEDVRANRLFAHQVARRRAWYQDLLARREALDAALLARVPGVAEHLAKLRAG